MLFFKEILGSSRKKGLVTTISMYNYECRDNNRSGEVIIISSSKEIDSVPKGDQ